MKHVMFTMFGFLFLSSALPAMAAPTLDGHATGTGSNSATGTATLTTSLTNDVIIVVVTTANQGPSAPTVTAISDTAGLTWTRRTTSGPQNDGSNSANQTVYSAFSVGALSSDTITLTFSAFGTFTSYAISAFGVNSVTSASVAPFDANGSLPATASDTSTGNPVSVTGVSTTTGGDFLMSLHSTRDNGVALQYPSGFTLIDSVYDTFFAGLAEITTAYKLVAVTTGATYTAQAGATAINNPQIMTIDALKGNGSVGPITSRGSLMLLGVGN